ncbi:MAG: N-acetylmuramoyl-L-alanine amidase [Cyanobacteria bacterium J055]|nr:MAG: N-acetylmuramoyl-L-alanine amidase [Cyanobacteria bacterium J055]
MANIASRLLRDKGYEVDVLDPMDTLEAMGEYARGSDVFVSLHLNAFNGVTQGTEVLIHRNGTAEDEKFAQFLLDDLVSTLRLSDRGVKRQGLAVLLGVPLSVRAACLTESYFVDAVDAATARRYTEQAARAIVNGIDRYAISRGLNPKPPASPSPTPTPIPSPSPSPSFSETLTLVNVAKFYKGLPHQNAALEWLQQKIPSETFAEFARRWRQQ